MASVLFITFMALEANSSVTKSNYGILSGLHELGYDITVVMPQISQSLSYFDDNYNLDEITNKIVRIPSDSIGSSLSKQVNKKEGIKRKLLLSARNLYIKTHVFERTEEYVSKASVVMSNLEQYYDFVITTSDPKASHLMVSNLKKYGLKYGKWIQHWGDPIMGDITRKTLLPSALLKHAEYKLLNEADKIIYVSPFTLKEQKNRYHEFSDKMHFAPLPADMQTAESGKRNSDNRINVVYLGDYYSNVRNIIPLYNAIKNIENAFLTIAGGSDVLLDSTERITVLPRISQEKCNALENEADLIISIGNLKGSQIPGKIYYSSSNHKPILCIIDGENEMEMKQYLSSYDRFDCCINQEIDINKKIKEIIERTDYTYATPDVLLPKNVAKMIMS